MSNKVKDITRKNYIYYFFDIIKKKKFDPKSIKIEMKAKKKLENMKNWSKIRDLDQ